MFGTVVSLAIIAVVVVAWWINRAVRRRNAVHSMYVPTHPDIELSQRYGGWDAGAYDAGSGHHSSGHSHSSVPQRPPPSTTNQGFGRR